jgi:hypothetical protein
VRLLGAGAHGLVEDGDDQGEATGPGSADLPLNL